MRPVPAPGRLEEELGSGSEWDVLMERGGGCEMKERKPEQMREGEGLSQHLSTQHVGFANGTTSGGAIDSFTCSHFHTSTDGQNVKGRMCLHQIILLLSEESETSPRQSIFHVC